MSDVKEPKPLEERLLRVMNMVGLELAVVIVEVMVVIIVLLVRR